MTNINLKKKANLSEDELDRNDLGDRWTFVNVLPRSGFIQTVHHGKRTKAEGEEFVKTIKQNSDGEAPLFLSDGWLCYPEILANTYSHEEPVPYRGRGRPRKPLRIIDDNLKYAQVVKHKEGSHLIEIEKCVIWGTEEEILEIIRQEGRGQTIHTSYVESRNGNYRKDNKRLARRSACQSKDMALHDAQIDFPLARDSPPMSRADPASAQGLRGVFVLPILRAEMMPNHKKEAERCRV